MIDIVRAVRAVRAVLHVEVDAAVLLGIVDRLARIVHVKGDEHNAVLNHEILVRACGIECLERLQLDLIAPFDPVIPLIGAAFSRIIAINTRPLRNRLL